MHVSRLIRRALEKIRAEIAGDEYGDEDFGEKPVERATG